MKITKTKLTGMALRDPTLSFLHCMFTRWHRYILQRFAISGNSKESFSPILDSDVDLDHHQTLITSKLGHV